MNSIPQVSIENGYRPGAIGRIAELHGTYYHEHWKFGVFFEAKVATELSAFLKRFQNERDGIWLALNQGRIEGSIAIDGSRVESDGAHLRWFILSQALKGNGVGKALLDTAVTFCRQQGYQKLFLWTFDGLMVARHLYETAGFQLIAQHRGEQWGTPVHEQRFELMIA